MENYIEIIRILIEKLQVMDTIFKTTQVCELKNILNEIKTAIECRMTS